MRWYILRNSIAQRFYDNLPVTFWVSCKKARLSKFHTFFETIEWSLIPLSSVLVSMRIILHSVNNPVKATSCGVVGFLLKAYNCNGVQIQAISHELCAKFPPLIVCYIRYVMQKCRRNLVVTSWALFQALFR